MFTLMSGQAMLNGHDGIPGKSTTEYPSLWVLVCWFARPGAQSCVLQVVQAFRKE